MSLFNECPKIYIFFYILFLNALNRLQLKWFLYVTLCILLNVHNTNGKIQSNEKDLKKYKIIIWNCLKLSTLEANMAVQWFFRVTWLYQFDIVYSLKRLSYHCSLLKTIKNP